MLLCVINLKSLRLLLNSWAETRDCVWITLEHPVEMNLSYTHTRTRIRNPGKKYKSTRNRALTWRHRVSSAPSSFVHSFILLSRDICICFACFSKRPVNRATSRAIATWTESDRKLAPGYGSDRCDRVGLLLGWQETNENFQTIWLICREPRSSAS